MKFAAFLAFLRDNRVVIKRAACPTALLLTLIATVYLPHAEGRAIAALALGMLSAVAGRDYLP